MRRTSRGVWWVVCALVAVPAAGAQDKKEDKKPAAAPVEKKDEKKPGEPKKPDEKKMPLPTGKVDRKEAERKLATGGVLTGEVTYVETDKQTIRVRVSVQYTEINPGAVQGLAQARLQLAQARDPNGRLQALQSLAQHQRDLYQIKSVNREVEVGPGDNMVVRMAQPKPAFDDSGNVKKLTAKDLAALRGKDRLYDGEFSDLTTGQIVQIALVKPKTPVPTPKNKDDINLEDFKPKAARIVVLRQALPGR